jgi:hypothetical protein
MEEYFKTDNPNLEQQGPEIEEEKPEQQEEGEGNKRHLKGRDANPRKWNDHVEEVVQSGFFKLFILSFAGL